MKPIVCYLMSGPAHLPYLLTSLYQLRKHYHGEICVYAWPESYWAVELISHDRRLGIKPVLRSPVTGYRGKNAQFFDKLHMMGELPLDVIGVYLDADTMPVGPIDKLIRHADQYGFAATQFNGWLSNRGVVRRRISRLLGRKGIDQSGVEMAMLLPLKSVNGGVFACRPNSRVLSMWREQTSHVLDIFIADETVLHATLPIQPDGEYTVLSGKYNSSPKHKDPLTLDEDVVIWHMHGDSNVRLNKCVKGIQLWWPVYCKCVEDRIGNVSQWHSICNNRYLDALIVYAREHNDLGLAPLPLRRD